MGANWIKVTRQSSNTNVASFFFCILPIGRIRRFLVKDSNNANFQRRMRRITTSSGNPATKHQTHKSAVERDRSFSASVARFWEKHVLRV